MTGSVSYSSGEPSGVSYSLAARHELEAGVDLAIFSISCLCKYKSL